VLTTSGLAGYSPLEDKAADTPGRAQLESSPIAGAAVLIDGQSKYLLGLYLDILEDPTKALTIGEVSSAAYASKFIPSQVEVPNYGYTESAYWVRLRFDNQTKQTMEWLLEDGYANTQYADLYLPSTNGNGFEVRQTGSLRPVSTRDIPYPNIIFSLNIPPQSQPIFYLRFQSGASMTLPLTLWTKDAFIVNSAHSMMLHWLLFGGFLALLVYHLFLLFTVRELIYVYFAIMIASMLAMLLEYTGYLSVYILPSLYNLKPYYIPVIISVMYISIIIFSDAFLELNSRIPELHWANLFMVAVWAGILILTPFVSYLEIARLATPWMLVTIGLTWVIGIAAWKKGAPPTRFFMFAWLGMAASLFLWVLVRLAFIPSTAFTENLFEVGFIVMAVSWSIALADRINLLKAETERANQSIQQSQHELAQILDGVPLGIVVYGLDQTPRYVNQRAIDILSNPDRGIQPTVQAQRTLAEALDYFSFHISGTKEKYPLDKLPIYSALKGQFASVDDVEADLVVFERFDRRGE
jgi:PAS domain-containing protein